jgi:hypothetical protein
MNDARDRAVTLGQQRPTRMRRIGARHMIVLPAQTAQVLSVDDIEHRITLARSQRAGLQEQLGRVDAFIADLKQQVDRFRALPVERDPDDPEVPQPDAEPGALDIALARSRASRATRVAGAAPVEPPVLTDD